MLSAQHTEQTDDEAVADWDARITTADYAHFATQAGGAAALIPPSTQQRQNLPLLC